MMHGVKKMMLTLAALQVVCGATAQAQTNVLRCEAHKLRCESRFYWCLSRCDRRAAARAATVGGDAQVKADRCEAKCEAAHSRRMARIQSVPPCQDVVITPDPMLCEALYLKTEASFNVCRAGCASREDPSSCVSACETRYETALDQLRVDPVCRYGRASSPLTSSSR